MLLPSTPAGAPALLKGQDRPVPVAHSNPLFGQGTLTALPFAKRSATTIAMAAPDTELQPAGTATAQLDTGLRLHPDALARRQKAQRRQEERNNIVALRQQMKSQGRGWWETTDTVNCFTVRTDQDYQQHLGAAKEQQRLVVCLFFAPWCMACRALHPKVEQLAEQNPDVLFVKANVEQMQELASSLQIKSMPWFIFYKGAGEPVAKFTASLQPNRLAKLRAEIALHKA